MSHDAQLLRRYALEDDQAAFSELVRGSIDFVYATALRQCRGNAAQAQDVTQLVFTDLSRRAKSLLGHPTLAGWLHTATRFAAMKILRSETRRQVRDQQAAEMQALLGKEDASVDWSQLRPVLDDALGELKERDRTALLLRFFQGKSLNEVGDGLRLSESAARSCVDRALERLRSRLARHGITSTSSALGIVLAQQTATAAPAGFATSVSGVALAQSATAGAALVPLFIMKKILLTAACLVFAGEFAVATAELKKNQRLEAEYHELAGPGISSSVPASTASTEIHVPVVSETVTTVASPEDAEELNRLEKRLAVLKARPEGVSDEEMKPPQSVGRATPQNAMQTLSAALRDKDLNTLDGFVFFTDDTPENREAFMAQFSPAVRARYRTPERLVMAFSFDQALRDPPIAGQVLSTQNYSNGKQLVVGWTRLQSGEEKKQSIPFENTPGGWALSGLSLKGSEEIPIEKLRARIDPMTGNILPPKK
ncbi:MAG: sigma-70 family RNA polymerase sigma factor [Nibricoccus sp.]